MRLGFAMVGGLVPRRRSATRKVIHDHHNDGVHYREMIKQLDDFNQLPMRYVFIH
ncbi:hypothetical protein [Vibrio parahaemolyticus]|uniref:hypothetical protein n=1 Tax=Vibrio parahaemolyticus TaxID=670 RepID=UPI0015DFDB30|nr:hypothetical protein [Vibrio parahaemolyticus]